MAEFQGSSRDKNSNASQSAQFIAASESSTQPASSSAATLTTASSLAGLGPSHVVVAEEYTVGVPLVRAKPEFLKILKCAGATGEIFTKKEICQFLKEYIGSRHLYNPADPREVFCGEDSLGKVFGVKKFTINDVLHLINKNCNQLPDTCIKRKRHLVARPIPSTTSSSTASSQQPEKVITTVAGSSNNSLTIKVCHAGPVISSSTEPLFSNCKGPQKSPRTSPRERNSSGHSTDSKASGGNGNDKKRRATKRKLSEHASGDSSDNSKKKASVSIKYSEADSSSYPWYFRVKVETDDESEALSIQGKETAVAEDSTDDLWFLEEDSIAVEVESDTFSLEYEVESEKSEHYSHSDSSSEMSGKDVLVLCKDSDMEFWADSSGGETDTELSDADKWFCSECFTKNLPLQRYCSRCWKLRPGWLPEKSKKGPIKKKKVERSLSAPGNMSSSESSDVGKESCTVKMQSRVARHGNYNYDSDSSVDKICTDSQKLESYDSGVFTSPTSLGIRRTFLNYQIDESKNPADVSRKNDTSAATFSSQNNSQSSGHGSLSFIDNLMEDSIQKSPVKECETAVRESGKKNIFHTSRTESVAPSSSGANLRPLASSSANSDLCVVCLTRPKTGSIIHGCTGHQVCCYRCARRLKRQRRPCPVCRRPIQKVVKNFIL